MRNKSNKLLLGIALVLGLVATSTVTQAQRAIVAGESSAGVYPNIAANTNSADTVSTAVTLSTSSYNFLFNGTSWDRQRTNLDAVLINAVAATTSQTSADQVNFNGRGVIATVNMTAVGIGSVTCVIQGRDPTGQYYTLLSGAAIITNVMTVYTVYPGAPTTATVSTNSPLSRVWRINCTANNANATSYTVAATVVN